MILTDERWYSTIADAIRTANGETASYSPRQMAEMLPGMLAATPNNTLADTMATGSGMVNIMGPRASFVGANAFSGMRMSVGIVDFPRATWVGQSAFYECGGIMSVRLSRCSYVGEGAFAKCTSLVSAYLPACVELSSSAFASCSSLSSVAFGALEVIGSSTFYSCVALSRITLPRCTSVGRYAFGGCQSLASLSLPACRSIGPYAFSGCAMLSVLNLVGVPSVPSLSSGAFNGTPIGGYSLYHSIASIFVDEVLYGSFVTAWASVSSRIVSVPRG